MRTDEGCEADRPLEDRDRSARSIGGLKRERRKIGGLLLGVLYLGTNAFIRSFIHLLVLTLKFMEHQPYSRYYTGHWRCKDK